MGDSKRGLSKIEMGQLLLLHCNYKQPRRERMVRMKYGTCEYMGEGERKVPHREWNKEGRQCMPIDRDRGYKGAGGGECLLYFMGTSPSSSSSSSTSRCCLRIAPSL